MRWVEAPERRDRYLFDPPIERKKMISRINKAKRALEFLEKLVNDENYSQIIENWKSKGEYLDPSEFTVGDVGWYFVCDLLLEMDKIVND